MSATNVTKLTPDVAKIEEEREHLARADKSILIANVLEAIDVPSSIAARLSNDGWVRAARLAKVNMRNFSKRPYVSHPTRSAVVAILKDREVRNG